MSTMQKATERLQPWVEEIRDNPRLQLGLASIVFIALVFSLLKLDAERVKLQASVEKLYGENRRLQKQAGSEAYQGVLAGKLEKAKLALSNSQWQAASQLSAQAMFHDWLSARIVDAGVKEYRIAQPTARFVGDEQSGLGIEQQDCTPETCTLLELQSSVKVAFDPVNATKVLANIERSDWPLKIESLTIRPGDRKLEFTVKALARLSSDLPNDEPAALTTPPAEQQPAPAPSQAKSSVAAGAEDTQSTQPKKVVEIKW
ncbi:hypothetical protein [Chitinimonas sp. BJYL2]|uniref:hypothetical protein n=1 Tax=Chitinimonas sp. BJYL2 TaxID=2976696 RepID=UPI0022B466D5|nr:hypothetical protein [Chitinimonas sp. BJYL2]